MSRIINFFLCGVLMITGCSSNGGSPSAPVQPQVLEFEFSFAADDEGFSGGFADYPAGEEESYELSFEYKALPADFAPDRKGLFIKGHNHSDDLFMFIKKKLGAEEGIKANTVYNLGLSVEFATSAASGCVGIGGAPGESVYLKAGATTVEPVPVNKNGYFVMNIDKGEQASGGRDAVVLGHIGNNSGDCSGATFEFKTLKLDSFTVHTDDNGVLWLIIGTDSGFEGKTSLYYTDIKLTLTETSR